MAETASGVTYSFAFDRSSSPDEPFMDLGPPVPGFALRVVDDAGRVVSEGEAGRLQIKGCGVFKGYFKAPQENAETFTEDGWLKTGDLAMVVDGRLRFTGREKDVIVLHGANYYSHELESVVDEIPGVQPSFTAACAVRGPGDASDQLAISCTRPSTTALCRLWWTKSVTRFCGARASTRNMYCRWLRTPFPKPASAKSSAPACVGISSPDAFDSELKHLDLLLGNRNTLPHWFMRKVWRRREPASRPGVSRDAGLGCRRAVF